MFRHERMVKKVFDKYKDVSLLSSYKTFFEGIQTKNVEKMVNNLNQYYNYCFRFANENDKNLLCRIPFVPSILSEFYCHYFKKLLSSDEFSQYGLKYGTEVNCLYDLNQCDDGYLLPDFEKVDACIYIEKPIAVSCMEGSETATAKRKKKKIQLTFQLF